MYCISCGKQNDDQALFCTACGQRLVGQGAHATDAAAAQPASPTYVAPAQVLRFGLTHGDHKFMLGSVDFVDGQGRLVYTATRESTLHENYTLSQGETRLLFMRHKSHLSAYSFEMQDGSGTPMGAVCCRYATRKGELPTYSYSDPQGNTKAAILWEEGTLKFAICDPSSAQVFAKASVDLPGGVGGDLKALVHRQFMISIAAGTSLPLTVLLAFCVAVVNLPPI